MKKQFCYYIPQAQDPEKHGGYVPSLVYKNEAGHSPMLGRGKGAAPWVWGKTLDEAEKICEKANADLGLTKGDVINIVASSFSAGRVCRCSVCGVSPVSMVGDVCLTCECGGAN